VRPGGHAGQALNRDLVGLAMTVTARLKQTGKTARSAKAAAKDTDRRGIYFLSARGAPLLLAH
jgi:hypothetical protein